MTPIGNLMTLRTYNTLALRIGSGMISGSLSISLTSFLEYFSLRIILQTPRGGMFISIDSSRSALSLTALFSYLEVDDSNKLGDC
jgi:hypothetical protein